ncbi:MAG: hypothetical protein R3263_05545 [Myxococcota bacterium]|nr:hypothetical protein [Myxococcota bacterium]
MAGAALFDRVAEGLAERTGLDDLAARGTLRIALKSAGLDPKAVTGAQMAVVLDRVLPGELESRGVTDPAGVCRALASALGALAAEEDVAPDSPEAVFRRMREGASAR